MPSQITIGWGGGWVWVLNVGLGWPPNCVGGGRGGGGRGAYWLVSKGFGQVSHGFLYISMSFWSYQLCFDGYQVCFVEYPMLFDA